MMPPPLPGSAATDARLAPMPFSPPTTWLLGTVAGLTFLILGSFTLLLMGFSTGLTGLLGGIVLALLPLPIYLLLVLWIDRFEKEPVWMLVAAFFWGATVAVFFAYILNTVFAVVAASIVPPDAKLATAALSAPLIEELGKAVALVVFYFWKRDEFDNVTDGIIYAAMVGLGFAMSENISYYGNALATGGLGASIFTFFLRGVVSPFAHPFFTSMTGIGLGLARVSGPGSPIKFLGPVCGIALAMFFHGLWNFSAAFGAAFLLVYVLIMVPAFLGVVVLVVISLIKEGKIVRQYLARERESGLLDERTYTEVSSVRGRLAQAWRAFWSGGYRRWHVWTQFHEAASELAFHRWRTARGIFPRRETPEAREAAYRERFRVLRAQLT